jgi:hypothetical protein
LNLLVDSTGIKFLGDGEWQAPKHGVQGRRQWRKVHLAMDTATSDIRAVEFTPSSDGDSPVLPDLLAQIPEGEDIGTVTADGAYDSRRCHTAIIDRQAFAIIPIRKNGRPWKETARPQSRETKPYARPGTTAGRSGSAGPDITSEAGSRRRCGASKPSANASPQETLTARPPKSTSASL